MGKIFHKLFSLPAGVVAGIVAISVLVFAILQERSVQPLQNHLWAEEMVSLPMIDGVVFNQVVVIPEGLEQETFLLALFFGCEQEECIGDIAVTLSQESHKQVHSVSEVSPAPTSRQRFKFDGFFAGPAVLKITGMIGNSERSPGLLYIEEGAGAQLEGPGIETPAYASVDWFKVVSGNKKLSSVFPNSLVSLVWLFSFAGFFTVAWAGMKPITTE